MEILLRELMSLPCKTIRRFTTSAFGKDASVQQILLFYLSRERGVEARYRFQTRYKNMTQISQREISLIGVWKVWHV